MARKKTKKKKQSYDIEPSYLWRLIRLAIVLGLWCGIGLTIIFGWYALELPSITRNAKFERKASITIKAADGSVIGRYGDIKGNNIEVKDMPEDLIHAVLAVEDRRFYSHWGIDVLGLARAVAINLIKGKVVQGGSTLTQQLAKNLFLSQERTLKRKIQEAMLALWLEHEMTKDEILASYLNRVYMGSGTYGVEAAARVYFQKRVKNLTLRESATIAGLLKAPSRYSPLSNPELSHKRTDTVIKTMEDAGYITEQDVSKLNSTPPPKPEKSDTRNSEKYYTDWIVDSLQDLIGTPEEDIVVETTMDPRLQKVAAESLAKMIEENGEAKHISQGAVVVMRPMGEVLAIVGGRDYNSNQFNRATQALRQPGSSFKPFVYLAALEYGYQPYDVVLDEKFTEGRYRPKNFGNEYYGEVALETALALSLNTVSVRLTKEMGPARVIDVARRMGFTSKLNEDLSQALGTNTLPPLEITGAYAAIANGGIAIHPYGIKKITSETGKLYYQHKEPRDYMRVIAGRHIDTLTKMMRGVVEYGTGQNAKLGIPVSGKTGTSQGSRDAWFIGFTNELVASVWMGNDDNTPMKNVTGGSFPARVWRETMASAVGRYPAVYYAGSSESSFYDLMNRMTQGDDPAGDRFDSNRFGAAQDANDNVPSYQPRGIENIPDRARFND